MRRRTLPRQGISNDGVLPGVSSLFQAFISLSNDGRILVGFFWASGGTQKEESTHILRFHVLSLPVRPFRMASTLSTITASIPSLTCSY